MQYTWDRKVCLFIIKMAGVESNIWWIVYCTAQFYSVQYSDQYSVEFNIIYNLQEAGKGLLLSE